MKRVNLGRTGLKATVMGLGCGGPSRLGQRTGRTEAESVQIIEEALNLGINLVDTAEGYGTEPIIGRAIEGWDRRSVILSTKKSTRKPMSPEDVKDSLDSSLKALGTDYIDIYSLHAVAPDSYDHLYHQVVPLLQDLRDEGTIRFIGITEFFNRDNRHFMLRKALQDDVWDVVMVGFNILNQTARENVLNEATERGKGTLVMFAVRKALSRAERLQEVVRNLIAQGKLDSAEIDERNPLGFLIHEGGAVSLTDAAYRFCRDEPGTDVILSGTGSIDHLRENVESFCRPPLPKDDTQKLRHLFRRVHSVTGE